MVRKKPRKLSKLDLGNVRGGFSIVFNPSDPPPVIQPPPVTGPPPGSGTKSPTRAQSANHNQHLHRR